MVTYKDCRTTMLRISYTLACLLINAFNDIIVVGDVIWGMHDILKPTGESVVGQNKTF
jgi:hypothetical protein